MRFRWHTFSCAALGVTHNSELGTTTVHPPELALQTIDASIAWAGPNIDAFTLFVEPTPFMWAAEPVKPGHEHIYLYQGLDRKRQRTGQLAGVHIVGFLNFEAWHDLPDLPVLC